MSQSLTITTAYAARPPRHSSFARPFGMVCSLAIHAAILAAIVALSSAVFPPEPPPASVAEMIFEPTPAPEAAEQAAPPQPADPPPPPAPMPDRLTEPAPPRPATHFAPQTAAKPQPARHPAEAAAHPPSAIATATPNPTPAPAPVISAEWQSALSTWLGVHKRYPEAARRRSEQGKVLVHFIVAHDGHVLDVGVVQGSGSTILDQAAQSLLTGAELPLFPPTMTAPQVGVTVAIVYALEH